MSDELKEEGLTLFRRGLRDEALEKFEAAAASYEAAGDPIGQGEVLNNVGVIQRVRRNETEAIDAIQRAEKIFAEAGDVDRQAQTLGNLGDVYADMGKVDEAIRCYSTSAEMFAKVGDHEKQSQVLRALGLYYLRQRQITMAMMVMERSYTARPHLNIFQRLFLAMLRFFQRLAGGSQA